MKNLRTLLLILLPLVLLLVACSAAKEDGNGGIKTGSAVNKPEDLPEGDSAFELQGVEFKPLWGSVYVVGLSGNYTKDEGFTASVEKVFTFKLCGGDGGFIGNLWEPGALGLTSRTQYYGASEFYNSYYKQAVKFDAFHPTACSYQFNEDGELTELYECHDLSGINSWKDMVKERTVMYFFDYSCGSPEEYYWNEIEIFNEDDFSGDVLIHRMSEITGLDFHVTISEADGRYTVDWSSDSTLVAGLDDREQKEDFTFYDQDSLRWFMMDSLWQTLKHNMQIDDIYFTMDGGKELSFDELHPVNIFPFDVPYMGSAFYFAHANEADGIADTIDSISEDEAMDILSAAIDIGEGMAIVSYGQSNIDGESCHTFAYGYNAPEKFTAMEHYAVTMDGLVLKMDMSDGEYKEYDRDK